jgi:hypothetical protein
VEKPSWRKETVRTSDRMRLPEKPSVSIPSGWVQCPIRVCQEKILLQHLAKMWSEVKAINGKPFDKLRALREVKNSFFWLIFKFYNLRLFNIFLTI